MILSKTSGCDARHGDFYRTCRKYHIDQVNWKELRLVCCISVKKLVVVDRDEIWFGQANGRLPTARFDSVFSRSSPIGKLDIACEDRSSKYMIENQRQMTMQCAICFKRLFGSGWTEQFVTCSAAQCCLLFVHEKSSHCIEMSNVAQILSSILFKQFVHGHLKSNQYCELRRPHRKRNEDTACGPTVTQGISDTMDNRVHLQMAIDRRTIA